MKSLFLSIVLMAFMLVSCDNSQTPTEPQTSNNPLLKAEQVRDEPVNGVFYNECCDEFVEVSGIAHIVMRSNGGIFIVKELTGTGSSGNTYTGHNTSVDPFHFNSGNGASNNGSVFTLAMSNDEGCSFRVMFHFHITFNANGEPTAVIDKIETQCE
jgi:hypothetical protein